MSGSASVRRAARVVEQPLVFEPVDGLVYATDPATGARHVFQRHTFCATFRNAGKCLQDLHGLASAEIIQFPVTDAG